MKVRFRSEEELKNLAEERAMLQRRAKLKLELEARREVNRAIQERQKANMIHSHYRDCDGNLRRGKFSSVPAASYESIANRTTISPDKNKATSGQDLAAARRMRRRLVREKQIRKRRAEKNSEHEVRVTEALQQSLSMVWRRSQVIDLMEKSGFSNVASPPLDSRIVRVLRHDAAHPSFAERAYAPFPPQTLACLHNTSAVFHPIFHGLTRVPLNTPLSLSALKLLSIVHSLKNTPHIADTDVWRAFHSPPLCRGLARQRHHLWTSAHDRSEIIHPAIWGSLIAPNEVFVNVALTCPALLGYSMQRQVLQLHVVARCPDKTCLPVRRLASGGGCQNPTIGALSGFDDAMEPCHICLGGQLGCPFCFELPEGLQLHEYSYMPGDGAYEKASILSPLHTDLTTRIALVHDRHVRHDRVDVLIKSIPCGAVVKLDILCDDTIAHLHHLFRASSTHGIETLALFYVPTEHGLVEMDVETAAVCSVDDGPRLPDRGSIPLFRYGLNKPGASAVIFHSSHESMWSVINVFIGNNLLLQNLPSASSVVPHLDSAPRTLPGSDSVQNGLWKIFALQVSQHRRHTRQDEEAEQQHQRRKEKREMEKHISIALASRKARSNIIGTYGTKRTKANRERLSSVLCSLGSSRIAL